MTNDYEELVRECTTAVSMKCGLTSDELAALIETMREVGKGYIVEKTQALIYRDDAKLPPLACEYLDACRLEGQSEKTIDRKRYCYMSFFASVRKPPEAIDVTDVRRYLSAYKQERHVSDRTLETMRMALNALFKWLYIEEHIQRNIMDKIRPIHYEKTERKALTRYELELMRCACETDYERALFETLYSTGCRVSEMRGIMLDDVDWDKRTIKIYNGKGKKDRTVYFSERAKILLKLYIDNRCGGVKSPYLFVHQRAPYGRYVDSEAMGDTIAKIRSRSGVKTPATPHVMRHTFGTLAYQSGMPLEQIQVLLGHESIDTTRIYAEINDETVRQNHGKYVG